MSFPKVDRSALETVCKKLKVEDEQIRHHRDVFKPTLIVRKDGYMCPFIKKVDCAGKGNCETEVQEEICDCEEETVEEYCEEDVSQDEDECFEEEVEEQSCMDEDEPVVDDCEPSAPPPPGKNCKYELVCDDGPEDDDEDECVEDEEGECIRDEDDEGEDNLDDFPDFNASGKCDFERLNKTPDCCEDCLQKGASCCTPMSNFVIRIQAPFSEGSEESCEAVLEKLCKSRAPMYPEPKEIPKEDCDANNNIKVVAIIKEEPTCVATPKPCPPAPTTKPVSDGPKLDTTPPPCPNATKSPQEARNLPPPPCPPSKFTGPCSEKPQSPPPACPVKAEAPPSPCNANVENTPPIASKPEPSQICPPSPPPTSAATQTCPPKTVEPPEIAPPKNKSENQCYACGEKNCSCNKDLKEHLTQSAGLGNLPPLSPLMKKCEDAAAVSADTCSGPSTPPKKEEPKQSKTSKAAGWNYDTVPLTWNPAPPSQQCPEPEPDDDCTINEDPPIESVPCADSTTEQIIGPQGPPCPPKPCETICNTESASPPKIVPQKENDCCTLSPEELCRKKLKDIMCGCPKCVENRGSSPTVVEIPVWTPPPPSNCTHCGAKTRGDNDSCAMCTFVRRARDPYRYDYNCPTSFAFRKPFYPPCPEDKDKCNSKVFDMTPDGKPMYEGGMCLTRALNFLWKTNPEENSLRKLGYENECYEGFQRKLPDDGEDVGSGCTCEKHHRYRGGMALDEYQEFIWKTTAPKK